jgi:hypothetical protein
MNHDDVKFFEGHGFSYEYPGFLLYSFAGYDFTVGEDQREGRTDGFCVQISTTDGAFLAGKDCDTRDEVIQLLFFFKANRDLVISELQEGDVVSAGIEADIGKPADVEADDARAQAKAYLCEAEVRAYYGKHGFESMDTGGGCTALTKGQGTESGFYILITEQGGGEIPAGIDSPVTVGLYCEAHGDALAQFNAPDAKTALDRISRGEWT